MNWQSRLNLKFIPAYSGLQAVWAWVRLAEVGLDACVLELVLVSSPAWAADSP